MSPWIAGAAGVALGAVVALAWSPPVVHVRVQLRPVQPAPEPGELLRSLPYSRAHARAPR